MSTEWVTSFLSGPWLIKYGNALKQLYDGYCVIIKHISINNIMRKCSEWGKAGYKMMVRVWPKFWRGEVCGVFVSINKNNKKKDWKEIHWTIKDLFNWWILEMFRKFSLLFFFCFPNYFFLSLRYFILKLTKQVLIYTNICLFIYVFFLHLILEL